MLEREKRGRKKEIDREEREGEERRGRKEREKRGREEQQPNQYSDACSTDYSATRLSTLAVITHQTDVADRRSSQLKVERSGGGEAAW